MKKLILIITTLLIVFFGLTGCDKKDIEDLSIATAIGLDLDDEGVLCLSAQILDPTSMGNNPREVSPITLIESKGRTVQEALRKMSNLTTGKLFFYHFEVIVFGEKIARKGISSYLNFFAINHEALHLYNIVIAKGCKAKDILNIVSVLDLIPAVAFSNKVSASREYYGLGKMVTVDELVDVIQSEGIEPALTSIEISGDLGEGGNLDNTKNIEPKTIAKVSNIGIFKNDKLVSFLSENGSLGYTYLTNKINDSTIVVTKDDGILVSIEVYESKTKKKFQFEDNKLKIKLTINFEGSISEDLSSQIKYDQEYIKDITDKTAYEIRALCEEAINQAKEFKVDIFGFGYDIYLKHYQYWQKIKDNYNEEIFPEIEFEFVVTGVIDLVKS